MKHKKIQQELEETLKQNKSLRSRLEDKVCFKYKNKLFFLIMYILVYTNF